MYYHLFLDGESGSLLQRHIDTLLRQSGSLEEWQNSELGTVIKFSDESTFRSVREVWSKYAASLADSDGEKSRDDLQAVLKRTREYGESTFGTTELFYRTVRAAAPVGMHTMLNDELKAALEGWWQTGTTVPEGSNIPNPLFAATLCDHDVLSCATHPILGYHLAVAETYLVKTSPLKSTETEDKDEKLSAFVAAARAQFTEWVNSFIHLPRGQWTMEFAAADCLALCHTLQHYNATGQLSANLYRRQLSSDPLTLDKAYQNHGAHSRFDIVETLDSWDDWGGLNVLISAGPLLKNEAWATIYTRTRNSDPDTRTRELDRLLCAPFKTVSTLLGISPQEYWTNTTAVPNVDEYLLSAVAGMKSYRDPGMHWRLSWKSNAHLSGQPPGTRLRLGVADMVSLVHKVHQEMDVDDPLSLSKEQHQAASKTRPHSNYYHVSLVALVKRLTQILDVDCQAVCRAILEKINEPQLSLEMSRQGLYSQHQLSNNLGAEYEGMSIVPKWPECPESIFVTVSIPKCHWTSVYLTARESNTAFAVEGRVAGLKNGEAVFESVFSDVQIVFGVVETLGERGSPDLSVLVEEDKLGWAGESDLVATFPVPTNAVQWDPNQTRVSLCLKSGVQNVEIFRQPKLGDKLKIWETGLNNMENISVTRYPPGHNGHPIYNSLQPNHSQQPENDAPCTSHFTLDLNPSFQISSITGHLDVMSTKGKTLLAEKATVEVQKISPFVFEIALGSREAVFLLHFPVPVVQQGSKTRVARTSSYVEVIALLDDFVTDEALDDFAILNTLSKACVGPPTREVIQTIPVTLNIPHINLDALPILDVSRKDRLRFLSTLVSSTFSTRERKLRERFMDSDPSGLAPSPRMNLKESVFTMFMLASGLQGGQTGLFAINHLDKGGIHMLIFVSALRLDAENASAVLDAAVIPFTKDIIDSGELESFLLILRTLEIGTITVDDDELVLWKKALPALAERCRTWSHATQCEYAQPSSHTVPLSTKPGRRVLCSCGEGRLAKGFVSLPEWEEAAARHATRIAISPLFASPLVEEVVDPAAARDLAASLLVASSEGQGQREARCRTCGRAEGNSGGGGGGLRRCTRCRVASYCSAECQKKDWKKHRMECKEAEG